MPDRVIFILGSAYSGDAAASKNIVYANAIFPASLCQHVSDVVASRDAWRVTLLEQVQEFLVDSVTNSLRPIIYNDFTVIS